MQITRAGDLDEAVDALDALSGATVLAGGTDLMVQANFGHRRPERVVAVRRVPALREWSGGFLGAGVTYRRLGDGPHTALAELARTVGSPQIRNAGTVGGNLGRAGRPRIRERLSYPLPSDAGHRLVDALSLPTFTTGGSPPRIRRATLLVAADRAVREVLYPVPDPGHHAAVVLGHLRAADGGTAP